MRRLNLTGHRFGKLVVLADAGNNRHGSSTWLCRCDCGKELIIGRPELRNGDTQSCGCRQFDGRVTAFTPGIEYRDVIDFPGYRVGADGSVWSAYEHIFEKGKGSKYAIGSTWSKLTPAPIGRAGYLRVTLCKDGRRHDGIVHLLVARAFLGEVPEGLEACHNNGNHLDNRVENLRYDTHVNNMLDQFRHGTRRTKLTEAEVIEIRRAHANGERSVDLSRRFGVTDCTISNIVHRKAWRHVA